MFLNMDLLEHDKQKMYLKGLKYAFEYITDQENKKIVEKEIESVEKEVRRLFLSAFQ